MSTSRSCQPVWSPFLGWLLSPVLLMGLSACGPAPSDPAPGVESRTSLSGVSASHPIPRESPSSRNDPTKPVSSFVPHASVSDQKKDPSPRPDRSLLSDRANQSGDASEQPGVLPLMNVWTQEGLPVSVVALEDPTDDASLEEDANNERHNWDVAHAMEQLEDDQEQEKRSGERNE
ncbi:MAG: hypothetical protein ACT4PN_10145 [Nitrospiraceae bacterium]